MNKILTFALLCMGIYVANAQKSKFEWGFETGFNVSKIQKYEWQRTDVPLDDEKWLEGVQFALNGRYRLSSHWAMSVAVQAIQKGWKGQTDVSTGPDNLGMTPREIELYYTRLYNRLSTPQKNRLSYLSVPLSLEYRFWEDRLYAQAGGYWALVISSPWEAIQKTHEWGANMGFGYRQVMNKHWTFSCGTVYQHGFSDIYNSFGNPNTLPELARGNRTLAANMGLSFRK
ncbi:MAG: outer membrane beta-barrel protein [Saprospiraceae bacterium]|nr:outer membrane beta-barrel protein [Saprospiraceae bacterium]